MPIYIFFLYIFFIINLIAYLLFYIIKLRANKIFAITLLILFNRVCFFSTNITIIAKILIF